MESLALVADLVSIGIDNSVDTTTTRQVLALSARLEKRVSALEDRDFDGLNAKIARLNRLLEKLLTELLTELKAGRANELADKSLAMQSVIASELKLLNARTEEAFETGLDIGDAE